MDETIVFCIGSWLIGYLLDSRRQDRDQMGLLVHLEPL